MLITILALLIVYAWWAPASPLGRWLNAQALPVCRGLARQRPVTLVLLAVFFAVLAGLVAYAETEGLMIAAPAAAEGLTWFVALDVGAYVEIFAAVWLLQARGGFRTVVQAVRAARQVLCRPRAVRRAPRPPRPPGRRPPKAGSADDPWPGAWRPLALA